jgi:hypothetical protein
VFEFVAALGATGAISILYNNLSVLSKSTGDSPLDSRWIFLGAQIILLLIALAINSSGSLITRISSSDFHELIVLVLMPLPFFGAPNEYERIVYFTFPILFMLTILRINIKRNYILLLCLFQLGTITSIWTHPSTRGSFERLR